ncbi:MAG: histidine kinase, partial [Acidobacteria bacterium]|nr:histidine kinase [Acidobacteriota bacterium]
MLATGERRLNLLRTLGTHLTTCQTPEDVWRALERSLASDARDRPFTLTYVVEADGSRLTLASATNVAGADSVPRRTVEVDEPVWPIRSLLDGSATHVVVDLPDRSAWPSGPRQKPPTRAIAMTIPQQGEARPAGTFIAGLNPFH